MSYAVPTSPRRVLFLDHTAMLSGGEMALLNLVRQLDPRRYEPIVALMDGGPLATELYSSGIQTHVLSIDPSVISARKDSISAGSLLRVKAIWKTLLASRQLAELIRATNACIVDCNSLKADLIGALAGRLARRKVVWHVHDRIESSYLPPFAVRWFVRLANRLPHYIIANSGSTLRTLRMKDVGAISVIYPGMQLNPYFDIQPAPPANGSPHIGIVGRLAPWKGQHVFLHAAAEVLKQYPGSKFQIVGGALFEEHEYERQICDLAKTLGIEQVVEFTGFRQDVPELMAGMNVVVHASTTAEPFGMVIVQGMAAGRPVIATNGGGVREIIADGQTGIMVPMNDGAALAKAICRVLSDAPLAARLAEQGRQRARDMFTIERTAAQTMDLYDRLLGVPYPAQPLPVAA
jgi:glycosyltransferase involved in cell wall biosynthesis